MSNLLNNTTDLQNILAEVSSNKTIINEQADLIAQIKNVVDNLPEVGGESGGASIEMVNITNSSLPEPGAEIYYLNDTMTLCQEMIKKKTYSVVKGTIFFTINSTMEDFTGCTLLNENNTISIYLATG